MMKIIPLVLGLSFLLSLVACNETKKENATENDSNLELNFWLSGKVEGANEQTLYVETITNRGPIQITKGQTDKNGNFKLSGNIQGMGVYQLRFGTSNRAIPMPLVPGDKVKIMTSVNDFEKKPLFTGTEWAKMVEKYLHLFDAFNEEQTALISRADLSEEQKIQVFLKIRQPLDAYAAKAMDENPSNPGCIVLMTSLTPSMGFEYWNPEFLPIIQKVATAFMSKYEDSPIAAGFMNQAQQIEYGYREYQSNLQQQSKREGKSAPEIALKNPSGKVIKLSSLRGKYVLIDFWASWCGPCRKENPNVVRLYNLYKDKGFTVYSVSLDRDAEAWKRAIDADGLVWPNHVSDLLFWDTPLTKTYGFNAIPYTVLIDKQGKIIAENLRGPALEQKLQQLLGK